MGITTPWGTPLMGPLGAESSGLCWSALAVRVRCAAPGRCSPLRAALMPTPMSPSSTPPPVAPTATGPTGQPVDAVSVADAARERWRVLFDSLTQIIGKQGVAALYKRSLQLSRIEHPALAEPYERCSPPSTDLASLHAALSQLDPGAAAAAQAALGRQFADLLARLIGTALSERLLHPLSELMSPTISSGPAAKDPSP